MNAQKIILVAIYLQHKGRWDDVFNAVTNKVSPDEASIHEAKQYLKQHGDLNVLTIMDEEYPAELKRIAKPPIVINLLDLR